MSSEIPSSAHPTIGVFDSGIGGFIILNELIWFAAKEFIYVADTAYAPYGGRSAAEICARSVEISRRLIEAGATIIVIACHTASSVALSTLKKTFPLVQFIDMITPAVQLAAQATRNNRLGILATQATVTSGIYPRVLAHLKPGAIVTQQACPELAPLIEKDRFSPELVPLLQEYLQPLIEADVDTFVLGCTHYALLFEQIAALLPAQRFLLTSNHLLVTYLRTIAPRAEHPFTTPITLVSTDGTTASLRHLQESWNMIRKFPSTASMLFAATPPSPSQAPVEVS